jgi:hypothetical protein
MLFLLALSLNAAAETQVNTDTLRLTFDASGNLKSAFACFPMCVGENSRVQQFGDSSVINFGPEGSGGWQQTEKKSDDQYELRFVQGGASLTWRIPSKGYRIELETAGKDQLSLQSGESFRPREAAGFGTWLEQSRYAVMTDIGFDDTDAAEVTTGQWLGFRNRYWTLMAAPPEEAVARLETAEDRQDAAISIDGAEGQWAFYLGPLEPKVLSCCTLGSGSGYAGSVSACSTCWLAWLC